MKLLDLFKKREDGDTTPKKKKAIDMKELEIYSGMRVVVETPKEQMLFIADLQDPHGGTARLLQCSDDEYASDEEMTDVAEYMYVKLRGYNDHRRKAVFMEGLITQEHKRVWKVEDLTVTKVENERTFYRLNTDMDGIIAEGEGEHGRERRCRLMNISAGGASISSDHRYQKGDRFFLKTKLLENESEIVLYCQVLRVAEKGQFQFEYGCQFLELARADQEQIARKISAVEKGGLYESEESDMFLL